MTRRMTMATLAITVTLGALGACTGNSDSDEGDNPDQVESSQPPASDDPLAPATGQPATPSPVPSVEASSKGAIAIRGEWSDSKRTWIVHFHEDGTFTEDEGTVPDTRQGTYEVEADVVTMYGTDGKTTKGTIKGDSIVFDRATVKKL